MKRFLVVVAVLLVGLVLLPSAGLAQSKEEGMRLWKEAYNLKENSKSSSDLKTALEKYNQALSIFERVGYKEGNGRILNGIGHIHASWGQYSKAVEFYEKALEMTRKIRDVDEEYFILNNLGSAYLNLGQYPKALEFYEKSLEIKKRAGDVRGEGDTLNNLGVVYRDCGDYKKALEYHNKALAIKRNTGDPRGEGLTLTHLAVVFSHRGDYKTAEEHYQKAIDLARKTHDQREEAYAINNLGVVYVGWGQYGRAVECYENALAIKRRTGDIPGEGYTLNDLGVVCRELGDYTKALEYHNKALAIKRNTGDPRGEGLTLTHLAVVFSHQGDYKTAEEYYQKAIDLARKTHNLGGEAYAINNLGVVYLVWGQYGRAVECYENALAIKRRTGDIFGEGHTLNDFGVVYSSWGQYAKAVEYYEKSLEIRKKLGDLKGEAQTLNNLGNVYAAQGQYSEALTNFRKGLEIYKRIGVPTHWATDNIGNIFLDMGEIQKAEPLIKQANYNSSRGRLYLVKGDYPSAKNSYESLLKSAEQNRNADDLFTAYTGLGKAYEGLEDYKKSEEYYEKGMKFTEELRSSLLPAERKDFFEVRINGFPRSEPAKGLTRVRMKLNKAGDSIDSSEVTRARVFSDRIALRSQAGVAGVPQDILKKEEELVTRVAALKKERSGKEKDKAPERYDAITKEIEKAEAELNKFVAMLWEKYKPYAAVKYPRPMTLKESSLGPEEHVVIFDVSGEGVGVKLIKGKEIVETSYKKWKLDDLENDVKRFRQPFEQVDLRKFDPELAEALFKNLLARVLMDVPKGTPLVIIADGILAVLPFEALVVSGKATWKGDGIKTYPEGLTYLGDLYPISYYQSITALTLARTLGEKQKAGERLLVIADPVFEMKDQRAQETGQTQVASKEKEYRVNLMVAMEERSGIRFPRLPETATLASNLGSMFKGKSDLYTGMDATKQQFMKSAAAGLDQYRWAVFATHGVFSTKIPGLLEPFLALTLVPPGTDGLLALSDVMSLKLNADVVALTACQTGLGKELSGEGVMSMGRAFQYAGAKAILMSLWSVDETASVKLVESFFKHLKEGKGKLEALNLARKEVRTKGYEHPFFWAPFILVGEVD